MESEKTGADTATAVRDADRVDVAVGVRVRVVDRVDVADAEPPRESDGDGVGV